MKIKFIFLLSILSILFSQTYAQCTITATAVPSDIVCGDCTQLTAFGEGQGVSVFTEDFNSGTPVGWQSTSQATVTNSLCNPHPSGTQYLWMGDAASVPRVLTTTPYNFSTAIAGATLCFDMVFAEQGDATPCEGPDEPDEGVSIQYSTDGGTTWIDIQYFDPNGGNDPSLINWNNWCFSVPAGGLTSSTQFRWFQDNDSGAEYDHWGLDNVNIYFNDPTYEITWQHDGYSYGVGSGGGTNPTPVCPQTTTIYTVTMSNGTSNCSDQITVNVTQPTFRVTADTAQTICAGECVDLLGEATVIKSPAKTPTYENNELEAIQTGLGSNTSININVTGLNMTNVLPNSITSVCLNNLTFFGFNLFPPGQQTIGDLQISLECPDGTEIILVPSGVTTNTSALQGYSNTCFTPVSSTDISTGSSPYAGDFMPNESFNDLAGCTANGVWSINIESTSALSFGTGTFFGWSITFDDPEISYTGDYSWSPTTNMTNSSTLNPTVCPSATSTYTLTVADTAGCTSTSDDVTITIDNNCCNFNIGAVVTQPSCGASNGAIDISITNGSGNYTYDWTSGQGSNQDLTNIGAATYNLTVTDVTQGCSKDTTIILTSINGATITNVTTTPASCGNADGSITITATGGTAPLEYSIDGTTYQASNVFPNLGANSYTVYVRDANLCVDDSTATISNTGGATITNVTTSPASCGNADGSITITATGGTAPLEYSINGTTYQASNVFPNLGTNSYTVYVRDANLCVDDSTATISNAGGATITNVTTSPASCGNADGSITITATGGTAPLEFSIDGTTYQASNVFPNLGANSYTVYVRDANLCIDDSTATISNADGATITNVTTTPASCGNSDGSITITATGGTAPLEYSIDGTTYQASNVFPNLGANSYTVYVRDANLCIDDSTATISNAGGATITNIDSVNTSCGINNGSITITATGGTAPLSYSIDGGTTVQNNGSFTNLVAGTYNIVVIDANNCEATSTVNILNSNAPIINSIPTIDATCGNSDGSITIVATGGTAPLSYSINGGASLQTSNIFNTVSSGSYNIVVEDASGCTDDSTAQINNIGGPTISNVAIINTSCGNSNGTINISATGGTAPLTYSINGGAYQSSNVFNNLSAGSYNISVQDATACSTNSTTQIASSSNPSISNITATDENCNSANGTITVTAMGGTTPLSYSIDGGSTFQSNNVFNNLSEGNYNITVQDNTGCSTSGTTQINNLNGVDSLIANVSDVLCFGEESGSAQLSAYNGTAPYTYFLVNNDTLQNTTGLLSGLSAGDYATWVQDANGCIHSLVIQIREPSELVLNDSLINPSCFGNENGQVILTATGGTVNSEPNPYSYSFNGITNSNGIFLNVAEGNYTASVTDINGCETALQVQLNDPDPVFVEINPEDTSIILGETFTMSAIITSASGTVYQYQWSPSLGLNCTDCAEPFVNTYQSTEYALVFTDENGCQAYADIYVEVLNPNQYFIPNAFTPSTFDNTNNTFKVYGNHIKYIDMMIFNRWGEKIFESSSSNPEWDGTFKGKEQNPGVYNYFVKITFLNDDEVSEKGSITLIR